MSLSASLNSMIGGNDGQRFRGRMLTDQFFDQGICIFIAKTEVDFDFLIVSDLRRYAVARMSIEDDMRFAQQGGIEGFFHQVKQSFSTTL